LDRTYALISPDVFVQVDSSKGAACGGWAVVDGATRRGQHHAPDRCGARGFEHTQRAVARWFDQLVFVFRRGGRNWGCDMDDEVAAADGVGPALVALEIGREERQAPGRIDPGAVEQRAHV
jgi:hypothetical protein